MESLYLSSNRDLNCPKNEETSLPSSSSVSSTTVIQCVLCDEQFNEGSAQHLQELQSHLLIQHKLVIADIHAISDLPGYLKYWKDRLSGAEELAIFCSVIKTNW